MRKMRKTTMTAETPGASETPLDSSRQSGEELSRQDDALLDAMIEAAHEAWSERLVTSTSGNLSARFTPEHFAISAARSRLGRLRREEVVVVGIGSRSGRLVRADAAARPSRETPFHKALYERYPRVGAVLHCQSFAATVLACREGPFPDLSFIPEVPVYVGSVATIPFLPPGSGELARAVVEAFRDPATHVAQLKNHGQIAIGQSPAQAVERAAFLELAARMFLLSENRASLRTFSEAERALLEAYR